jgi:hypothetical protein
MIEKKNKMATRVVASEEMDCRDKPGNDDEGGIAVERRFPLSRE